MSIALLENEELTVETAKEPRERPLRPVYKDQDSYRKDGAQDRRQHYQ